MGCSNVVLRWLGFCGQVKSLEVDRWHGEINRSFLLIRSLKNKNKIDQGSDPFK